MSIDISWDDTPATVNLKKQIMELKIEHHRLRMENDELRARANMWRGPPPLPEHTKDFHRMGLEDTQLTLPVCASVRLRMNNFGAWEAYGFAKVNDGFRLNYVMSDLEQHRRGPQFRDTLLYQLAHLNKLALFEIAKHYDVDAARARAAVSS